MLDSPTTSYLTYVYSATASIKINQYKYINKKQKYLKPEKKKIFETWKTKRAIFLAFGIPLYFSRYFVINMYTSVSYLC